MQKTMKATVLIGKLSEHFRFHSQRLARDLHKSAIGRHVNPQEDGYARHPFHTHRSRFDTRAVVCGAKHRDHAARGKIDVANWLVSFVDHLPEGQGYTLKVG